MAEMLYSHTLVYPDNHKVDGMYSHAWLKPDNHTIDVIVHGMKKRIEYTEARGVIQEAWEIIDLRSVKIGLSDEVEFLDKFRDELGRRMPPVTSACALIANIYGASGANAGPTTVERLTGPNEQTVQTVYVERTHGRDTEYKYKRTKLDRLFFRAFQNEECLKAEFRDIKKSGGGNLSSGWLETDHIDTFWKTIKAHTGVRVDRFEDLMYKNLDKRRLNLANGILKSMNRHYTAGRERNYVALFPINFEDQHHTIARAEYDKTEHSLVVTYYDSLEYDGRGKCGLIRDAFVHALVEAEQSGRDWARGQNGNIKYAMETGTMQKQKDHINCGVFVCMLMLEAAGGDKPAIHERTIDEGDIRKARCIIARNHKKEPSSTKATDDDDDDLLLVSASSPKKGPNRAQKRSEKRSPVIPREVIVLD